LALTFGLLWLFDTLAGVRVHPIQYLLVGAAMCLFYLLELSLSEHIGFVGAYGVAAFGVVTLIASYARAVLGSTGRGSLMAGATGLLYGYLFALLTLERYALLVGSLGLFSALATVMHLTRNVDWHRMSRRETAAG
jgi:inner membrane protein